MKLLHILPLFCALVAAPAAAWTEPPVTAPVTVGETHSWYSPTFDADRRISVYLPSGYAESEESFPALYLIDGGLEQDFLHIAGTTQLGALWGRSRPVVVIGIETIDRRRELIGSTESAELLETYPTAGESARMRSFIRDEVMPFVTSRYRLSDDRAVIGESLAGLFIVETLLEMPDMFTFYAAISPSLWWDDERLSRRAGEQLAAMEPGERSLFLAIADEGGTMQTGIDRLVTALEAHPDAVQHCYVPRPDLAHGTIYHSLSPQALQFLFPTGVEHDPQIGFTPPCSPRS